ncbi:site-specific DNA-methyltransferase, partial [Citrobacter portucalensis]
NKKATLIYMDPPYATGMDFISKELESAYKDHMDEAEYLEYLRRRLILSREVLSDDGSIYLHIGHQMVSHVKLIMDEVFGKSNFRNIITRRKCSSKNYTKKQYANINDFVLFYSKNDNYKWSQPGITPDKEWIEKEYNKSDDRGLYKLVPIHAPGVRNGETGKEWKGMLPPPGKHWQYTPETLDELDSSGMIHWSKNGNPRKKVYLTKDKKIPLTDYWQNYRDAHHQSVMITGYPTEKNLDMLKMIVSASSEPGDLVLDPFCGSGTTLHAARDLGRRWIGMDQSITAAKSTIKRMNSGMEKMGDYVTRKNKEPATGSLFENEIIKT